MIRRTALLSALLMLLTLNTSLLAATYTANFDSGTEGWIGDGAAWSSSGGQDGGGYFYAQRNPYGPYLTPPTDGILYGDVAANFGNESINFSYYLKDISGNSASGGNLYMFCGYDTPDYTLWQWTPADNTPPQDWTQYSWTVDPHAAIAPAGWTNSNGGPLSWSDSWKNVGYWNFWTEGGTSGNNINAIDSVVVTSVPTPPPVPKQIGNHHQLFVDNAMVGHKSNVNFTLHQPAKHKVGGVTTPVLGADQPWEDNVAIYGTTIYDEQEKTYKMWYRTIDDTCYIAYATSPDGVNWTKPDLNLATHNGTTDNNICGGFASFYTDGFGVIKDLNDPDPKRRYKMLTYHDNDQFAAMVSPDGVDWSGPINPMAHQTGDVLSLYYDEGLGKYVGLTKRYINGKRSRLVTYSDDFVNWTSPAIIMTPDGLDPATGHIYSHVGYEYEGMRIGYISVYDTATELMDTQLVYSRDGLTWQRYRERESFLPLGAVGDFDSGMIIADSSGLIVDDTKISIYYSGWNTDHNGNPIGGGEAISGIGLAELRKDGFVSVDAGPDGGTLTTAPFVLPNVQLMINAVTTAGGSIRAELLDADGEIIAGYELSASSSFGGDSLGAQLHWSNKVILESLIGETVCLKLYVEDASLYSFWFAAPLTPGDANGDGTIDDADATLLATNWLASDVGWAEGDFNGDGRVDDADATLLATNWQTTAEGSSASVPEPGCVALLLAGLLTLLFRPR